MKKKTIFQDLLLDSKNKHSQELASFILKVIGIYYEVDEKYHTKRIQERKIVEARQMSMFMIRKHTDLTLKKIACLYNRDHSTVLHSIKKINDYKFYDKNTRKEIKDIEYIIKYRASAIQENADWRKEYFFVDLNNIYTLSFDNGKAIILSGYDEASVSELSKSFIGVSSVKKHERTGMYILEKKNQKKDD